MGLRRWVRARRITTPPPAAPLVPIGILAVCVAWAVFEAAWGILGMIEVLLGVADEDISLPASAAGALLATFVAVLGCYVLRLVVAVWVRRQPPDPPCPGPMNG